MIADWNFLRDWFNRQDQSLEQEDLPERDCESGPVVFPDNETPVDIVFTASLHELMQMLSSLEKGAQLSYPDEWHTVWWNFVKNWECPMSICDEVAACLTENNENLINALAVALANNPTLLVALNAANAENGGATPGQPITEQQAQQDFLPENVKDGEDCDLNALWGACLYLVQSGNRAITDVYEQIEVASNTIETMAIAAETIPAAGNYVSAAAQFADQLLENIAEGYAGSYTEEYEEQLACMLFCLAKDQCLLDLESVINAVGARLDFTEVLPDFGVLMTTVGAGTWSGDSIADVSFWIYFAALRFGQVYGSTVGIRPLTVLMSLGADQLASDNWEVLCDCPTVEGWSHIFNDSAGWGDWNIITAGSSGPVGVFVSGGIDDTTVMFGGTQATGVIVENTTPIPEAFNVEVELDFNTGSGSPGWVLHSDAGYAGFPGMTDGTNLFTELDAIASTTGGMFLQFLSQFGGGTPGAVFIKQIRVSSDTGTDPYA